MYSSSASVWLTFLSKFQSDDFCGFEKKWNDFYRLWSTVMAFIVFKFNFSGKGKYGQEANANCLWAHLMESWSHISSEEKPVWVPPSNCDVRPRKKNEKHPQGFLLSALVGVKWRWVKWRDIFKPLYRCMKVTNKGASPFRMLPTTSRSNKWEERVQKNDNVQSLGSSIHTYKKKQMCRMKSRTS